MIANRQVIRGLQLTMAGLLGLVLLVVFVSGLTGRSKVAAAPAPCNVLLMMDRSASIGDNWPTMRTQVENLLYSTQLKDRNVSLGYWTFSNIPIPPAPATTDYNAPYHTYVSLETGQESVPGFSTFMSTLPTNQEDILSGQTNYEQAFGFNNAVANNTPTGPDGVGNLQDMRSRADVLVLLTDGLPNYPTDPDGNPLDGNPTAVARGHAAREQYDGKTVIGAYITNESNPDLRSLNETINGDPSDQTNIGPLQFDSIEDYLSDAIARACNAPAADYSLTPVVNVDNTAVRSGDTINFSYSANNDTGDGTSGTSAWQLYDVTIDPSVQGNPLNFTSAESACAAGNSKPYCNGVASCASLMSMIGGHGTCDAVPAGGRGTCGDTPSTSPGTGTNTFAPGPNAFYSPPRCVTIGELALGTRVCSVLVLAKPSGSGGSNRASSAACVVVGKTPLVQVHGGDLRVGRRFVGDTSPYTNSTAGVYTSRFKITKDSSVVPNGRVYGSWVEYGVLAPGPIAKIASLSGYAGPNGGYDDGLSTSGCDKNVNKLTFANTVSDASHSSECGYYAEDLGMIPDVVAALTSRTPIDPSQYSTPLRFDQNSQVGLYQNTSDGVTIDVGVSTITKGKTYVVYVPKGTVTITDNITYADETYDAITDIPQLVIIAKDINIKENVTRTDAWLVAAGDGNNGGKIDTCAGFARPLSGKVCNQLLTINGPVMARELDLWRTKVDTAGCEIHASSDCSHTGDPAEIMNLTGGSILWTQGYGLNAARAQTTYTTELPPYF